MTTVNLTEAQQFESGRNIPVRVSDFFMIFNLICGEIIGLAGIVANIINIRIFIKQGYKDSVNVTLMALAISDLGALITMQVTNIMTNPWFLNADLPFRPLEFIRVVSFYPHNYFIRVSGFITAFAAFERCLCVVLPLKIKAIITIRRSVFFIVIIYIITILNIFTPYYYCYFDWKFSWARNASYLGISFREDAHVAFGISYFITDLFVPYFTFAVLILSNAVIAVKLTSKAKWRHTVAGKKGSESGQLSGKETRVVKMMVVLSVIFIICLTPQSAILTAVAIVQDLSVDGAYFDIALLCYCITFLTETLHSSVNIIVYYKMSSKYKETLQLLVKCHTTRNKETYNGM